MNKMTFIFYIIAPFCICFVFVDTSTSQCVYDFEYNGITKKCEATVPVIATRDFVNDGIKVHEIGFKPIAKVNNSDPNSFMWLLHTISPIHVSRITRSYSLDAYMALSSFNYIFFVDSLQCFCI